MKLQPQRNASTIRELGTGPKKEEHLQAIESKYQCDNCKRVTYIQQGSKPVGWHSLKLWNENDEPPNPQDICDSCSQAVLQVIGRRKHIERGRLHEPPMQEHPKSPEACEAQSKIIAARVARATTD